MIFERKIKKIIRKTGDVFRALEYYVDKKDEEYRNLYLHGKLSKVDAYKEAIRYLITNYQNEVFDKCISTPAFFKKIFYSLSDDERRVLYKRIEKFEDYFSVNEKSSYSYILDYYQANMSARSRVKEFIKSNELYDLAYSLMERNFDFADDYIIRCYLFGKSAIKHKYHCDDAISDLNKLIEMQFQSKQDGVFYSFADYLTTSSLRKEYEYWKQQKIEMVKNNRTIVNDWLSSRYVIYNSQSHK